MPHSGRVDERWSGDCTLSVRHGPLCSNFSLRFAFELDALGVVDEAVKDGIGESRIGNAQVPVGNGDLAGDQSSGMPKAVIEDFKNILSILDGNEIAHPVVQDEQAGLGQGTQQFGQRTIDTRNG
jgi:hypothetical protein